MKKRILFIVIALLTCSCSSELPIILPDSDYAFFISGECCSDSASITLRTAYPMGDGRVVGSPLYIKEPDETFEFKIGNNEILPDETVTSDVIFTYRKYIFRNLDVEPGQEISISVNAPEFRKASARVLLPQEISHSGIECSELSDGTRRICIPGRQAETSYYCIMHSLPVLSVKGNVDVIDTKDAFYFSDDNTRGEDIVLNVSCFQDWRGIDFVLQRLDKESYDCLRQAALIGKEGADEYVSMRFTISNIQGGYGIFSAVQSLPLEF